MASAGQGGTFNVDFGGVNKTGTLTIPNTGGWQTWQTITTTVQLSAGQQIMQVDWDSNGSTGYVGNLNWLSLTAPQLVVNAGSNFTVNAGATATFAGAVSGGIAPYTYGWTFGDGGTSSGSPTPSYIYANPGTYTATLTGKDAVGDVGTSSVVVTVNDVPPTVTMTAPTSGLVGVPVSFSASATDVSPAVQAAGFTYSWNFGDGGTTTGPSPSHTFAAAGTYTVLVTATDEYGKSGTASGTISIQPSGSISLKVTGFPSPDTAGTTNNVTVTADESDGTVDTAYTGTVHFTSSDSQATLPANYTFTTADKGAHTFSVTLKTAATQSITATDTKTSTITGTESGITVTAAAAQSLKVTGFPTTDTAGTAANATVTAYDPYGNIATGYTGTVHFTSSDTQATLPANYTFTAADNGTHTFSVTLKTAGTQSITATDTKTSTITGTESGITVHAAAANRSRSAVSQPLSTRARR